MSFQKLSHQPGVVSALKSALEKDRLPHALLFQGPAGSGQREAAMAMAKAIFCRDKSGGESCDACYDCRQIDKNVHPDFSILEPAEDARDIKVEEVRELMARASFKPFSANAKVFVIEKAERMNDIAQNAFLKTLEEPAGHTIFVLISSSPEGLLATIRSRVQTFYFVPAVDSMERDQESERLLKTVLEFVFYHASEPLKAPDLTRLDRREIGSILDRLMEYHRGLLLIKVGAEDILASKQDRLEQKRLAQNFSEDALMERIEFFSRMKEKINENLNVKLVLSVMWDTLASVSSASL